INIDSTPVIGISFESTSQEAWTSRKYPLSGAEGHSIGQP
ncbi:unnamed protein product, partial [marine sediment metagenome]